MATIDKLPKRREATRAQVLSFMAGLAGRAGHGVTYQSFVAELTTHLAFDANVRKERA